MDKQVKSGGDGRRALGRWGESVAATHLEARGYTVVERNWRCRLGEIDLVARRDDTLIFVEVKTRRGRDFGMPEEGVTLRKSQKLLEIGQQYIFDHNLEDINWRIDIIAVELDKSGKLLRCEHVENAVWGW